MASTDRPDLPFTMRTLPRDARGYPIPFIVVVDRHKQPQFTINDIRKVELVRKKRLCAICGKRMDRTVWFVGGVVCFLNPFGAFIDPPMHCECATYALQVCPFLAAPRYTKRIDEKKLRPGSLSSDTVILQSDEVQPAQPELFGLGATTDYRAEGSTIDRKFVIPQWDYIEFWHSGQRQPAPTATWAAELAAWQGGT